MRQIVLPVTGAYDAWRTAARALAYARTDPNEVLWTTDGKEPSIFGPVFQTPGQSPITVPKTFVTLAQSVVCHRDPARFSLLYETLMRLQNYPRLLQDTSDRRIAKLIEMQDSVHDCAQKMKEDLRFKDVTTSGRRQSDAWFEPTHYTLEMAAPFFAQRFSDMDWRILTPYQSAIYKHGELLFGEPLPKPDFVEYDI